MYIHWSNCFWNGTCSWNCLWIEQFSLHTLETFEIHFHQLFYEFIPPDGQGVSTFWLPSPLLQTVSLVRLHLQTDISPYWPYYSCCDPLLFGIKSLYFLNSLDRYSYCPVCSTSVSFFWEVHIQLSGTMFSQILFTNLVKNLDTHKTAVCFVSFDLWHTWNFC